MNPTPAFAAPIPLEQAQARLLDAVQPLGAEIVATADADRRYLAQALSAHRTQPAADLSAMDGYAMRADDVSGPWRVVGESAAGHPFAGALQAGEAIRISTGALMPAGGGAVLLQENAARAGDQLRLSGPDGPTARHIRRQGFDFGAGDALIGAGALINPQRIALGLSAGVANLQVGRLPSLAVLDSGDELAAYPQDCAAHQIPASNSAMLAAMAAPLCARIRRIGPVPDQMDALLAALDQAADCDVLVTTGGASVGDHDLMRPALQQWGATIDFWRVALKPGKPLLVARRGGQVILGLPGNPVSSFVTAYLFLLPLLRKLAGSDRPLIEPLQLELASPLPAVGDRTEFLRGSFEGGQVLPHDQQDSSALASLAGAHCLIQRPAGAPAAQRFEKTWVFPL